jgi:hypothetical protein
MGAGRRSPVRRSLGEGGWVVARVAAAVVLAAMPAAAQQAASPLQGFSIVLVQGDMAASDGRSALPEAAARAVDDMKGLLPFKSYHLVDSAWVLADSASGLINARLKGPDGVDYDVVLEALPATGGGQRVAFRLRESGSEVPHQSGVMERDLETLKTIAAALREKYDATLRSAAATKRETTRSDEFLRTQLQEAERRVADLEQRIRERRAAADSHVGAAHRLIDQERVRLRQMEGDVLALSEKLHDKHPDMILRRQRLNEARQRLDTLIAEEQAAARRPSVVRVTTPAGATLIETMFTMRLGETVVVGTSRTGVDKALVAVLTAVPQSKGRGGF